MSVNKVILVGNVGKDPEVRNLNDGSKVATLSLATTEKGYTKKNGEQVAEKTEWHKVVFWRGLAKVVSSYVKKGSLLYVEGKLSTRSWNDKDGNKRYTTEITASEMKMLGNKDSNGKVKREEEEDLPFTPYEG